MAGVLDKLWSLADGGELINYAPTIGELVEACMEMQPLDALNYTNGAQMRRVTTPVVHQIRPTPDSEPTPLFKDDLGRYGYGEVRVSTFIQRNRKNKGEDEEDIESGDGDEIYDLGQTEEGTTREEMRDEKLDTSYSEGDQALRLIQYFVSKDQAFFLGNDSECSGGWPWRGKTLDDDSNEFDSIYLRRAERYHSVFTSLVLNSTEPGFISRRKGAEEYLRHRVGREVAGVKMLPQVWAERFLKGMNLKRRPKTNVTKYRPALTVAMNRMADVHTIAVSDISRLFRSYELQQAFARRLRETYLRHGRVVEIVGVIEPIDYLTVDDTEGASALTTDIQALVMGRMAEHLLRQVLTGSIRGQIARLKGGEPINPDVWWFDAKALKKGKYVLDKGRSKTALRIINMIEAGQKAGAILRKLDGEGLEVPASENTPRRWLENPLLVGKQEVYGIVWDVRVPPLLVNEDGEPDHYRFGELQRFAQKPRDERNSEDTDPDDDADEGHLGTGVVWDLCERKMIQKAESPQKYTKKDGTKVYYSGYQTYHCRCSPQHKRKFPFHVTLNGRNLHAFIKAMVFSDVRNLLGYLDQDRERDHLAEQVARLHRQVRETHERMLQEASTDAFESLVWARAKQAAAALGTEPDEYFRQKAREGLQKDIRAELQRTEIELHVKQRQLAAYTLPTEWQEIKKDLVQIDRLGVETVGEPTANKLVRRLMRLDFKLENDALVCWLTWKTMPDARTLVPIDVKIAANGKRQVRLPEDLAWTLVKPAIRK